MRHGSPMSKEEGFYKEPRAREFHFFFVTNRKFKNLKTCRVFFHSNERYVAAILAATPLCGEAKQVAAAGLSILLSHDTKIVGFTMRD